MRGLTKPKLLFDEKFCPAVRVTVYALLAEDYELIGNINVHALDVNADAIATAVLTLAYDSSAVNEVAGKPGKSLGLYKPGATS